MKAFNPVLGLNVHAASKQLGRVMTRLVPLSPLFVTAGILLAGNGVLQSWVPLRAAAEGFSALEIGLLGTGYFLGFLVACFYVPRLLGWVGHIRAFSALAAIAAAVTLLLYMYVEPYFWIAMRALTGFCISGLFTICESWINSKSEQSDRARVLSIYRIIDLGAVSGAQFAIPAFGIGNDKLFAFVALFICLSLVPIAVADQTKPKPPNKFTFDIRALLKLAPSACFGVFIIGMSTSSFRSIGPVFAENVGLSETGIAAFMSIGILGGFVSQYPFGLLSDVVDRRVALMIGTAGAVASGCIVAMIAGAGPMVLFAGSFLFGAFAMPLYSLATAHANDRANADQYVLVAAGMMFFFSVGASIGPLFAALIMDAFGDRYMFVYIAVVHSTLFIAALARILVRPQVPRDARTAYVPLLRTSPVFAKYGRADGGENDQTTIKDRTRQSASDGD